MASSSPIVLIIGTRPEGIKMLPVYFALKEADVPVVLCSTMQHDQLLQDVFDLFGVMPDIDLGVMRIKQDLFYVTQSLLQKTKEVFQKVQPSLVLVQGDTTSTMAAAMAAFYLKIPVGHIEAGLRTDDIYAPFPEEMNRRVVSTFAQFHFAPTSLALDNLRAEQIDEQKLFCTGNTVVDALRIMQNKIVSNEIVISSHIKKMVQQCKADNKKLVLLTMHRRESFNGGIKRVLQTVQTFLQNYEDVFCVYPFHPNPHVVDVLQEIGLSELNNCYVSEPLPYQDLVYLLSHADFVLTDSGGIQEEAISLGKPTIVLREKTERKEGVIEGLAQLVGTDQQKLNSALQNIYMQNDTTLPSVIYGDGFASEKIAEILKTHLKKEAKLPVSKKQAENGQIDNLSSMKNMPFEKCKTRGIMKKVTVLGLGYIGLPTSIVCAESGFDVVGFDIDQQRVDAINQGEPVIKEPDLFEKLQIALQTDRFCATTKITQSDFFIIAVPTPFKENKQADLSYVFSAGKTIASVLKKNDVVILESTVPVGATEKLAQFLQQESGLLVGTDFFVAHCPERVLPGKIFKELVENDRVLGGINQASVYAAQELYKPFVTGNIYLTDAKTAEMVKLIENSSRDTQIAFAHQVASMAYAVGLNPYEVIELANKHPRVNILKPSCGVGGHCIAVDPWFLIETFNTKTKLLQSARNINDGRPLQVVEYIFKAARQWCNQATKKCNVLLMGLTYKPDVDDMRESPAVRIADLVKENGSINMMVCEPHLNQQKLTALYPDEAISITEGLQKADVVVFLVGHTRFRAIDKKILQNKKVLDFCGILHTEKQTDKKHLYWPASSLEFFMPEDEVHYYTHVERSQELG
ncbi:MAG: UDP-N-acetylglucosamine 2-epimerase (non-hydrolyzing) [Candidatus Dependentiae bacterium]